MNDQPATDAVAMTDDARMPAPTRSPAGLPDAVWWSEDAGRPLPTTARVGELVSWNRASFPDDLAVSRQPVTLAVEGGLWSVRNGSAGMSVFLLDRRNGRRPVSAKGSLSIVEDVTHILLPRSTDGAPPFVVTVRVPGLPPVLPVPPPPGDGFPGDATHGAGEPDAAQLEVGLVEAARLLTDSRVRETLAAFARPYFVLSCADLAPENRTTVARCLAKASDRGERVLKAMREALWGRASAQPTDLVIRLLLRHELLTWTDVLAVPHVSCGHDDAELYDAREWRRAVRLRGRPR